MTISVPTEKGKTMREILFRGKCVDTGNWYEGGYIHLHKTTHCPIGDPERFSDNDIHQIVFERMTDWELPNQHYRVDVDPKTVGQFTGLTDKNGKKIFEGDIVEISHDAYPGVRGEVFFKNGSFMLRNVSDVLSLYGFLLWCEAVGNIHDNPELLGGDGNAI